MQRKPFKKSHKLRNTLIAFLAFIIAVLIIFVVLVATTKQLPKIMFLNPRQ